MFNDTTEILKQLRAAIERNEPLDIKTRDLLLFTAIISLFEQLQPIRTFYKVGMWGISIIGTLIVTLFFAIITGQYQLVKP